MNPKNKADNNNMPRAKSKSKAKAGPFSQRELARRLGVDAATVNDAIARGQLAACVTYVNGKPKIRDLDAAEAEWRATRRPRADDDVDDRELVDARGDRFPEYQVSRAKREYHLAEIAEAEARKLSGGEWLPVTHFEELEARFTALFAECVRYLRERLPLAVHRRIDIQSLARLCADHGARTKHVCGQPLGPLTDPESVFRLAMDEIRRAVDEVCTELADLHARADNDEDDKT